MFGDLIEKATTLIENVMKKMEARARVRTRFQVAGEVLSIKMASAKYFLNLDAEARNEAYLSSLQIARELESVIYADADPEIEA